MIKCSVCRCQLDERKDVRWDVWGGGTLCSLGCIWKFRGKHGLV